MPFITVELWEGYTIDQKRKLTEEITSVVTDMGPPREQVWVLIKDNPKHNWAIGGKLCSEMSPRK